MQNWSISKGQQSTAPPQDTIYFHLYRQETFILALVFYNLTELKHNSNTSKGKGNLQGHVSQEI